MGVELSSEADLERRIAARRSREGERSQVRCRRCRKAIPESRRRDAVYCSALCHNRHSAAQGIVLRTEVRGTMRSLEAPRACACGAALDNRPGRHGPVGRSCKRCRDNRAAARYRQKLKGAGSHEQGY